MTHAPRTSLTLSQRRRLMGAVLAGLLLVTGIISLVTKDSATNGGHAAYVAWFDASGRTASHTTARLFDQLLNGLSHSKPNNGGPGILQDKPICVSGEASVETYTPLLPPSGAVRTRYQDVMRTGSAVFHDCLAGISAPAISTSKHDVELMLGALSTYSTEITSYERALTAVHL